MSLLTTIKGVFSGENSIINQVKDVADTFITTKQEKREFDAKIEQLAKAAELQLIEADNKNVADARDMQKTALIQDDKFSKHFIYYLAAFWSVVAAGFIIIVLFKDIPEANTRLVDTILGFLLGTIIAAIINFFFGSSKGSHDKNNLIKK